MPAARRYRGSVPERPHRLLITGCPGSGKSHLAATLAARLGIPHIELDSLFHGPNWVPADPAVFAAQVQALAAGPEWIFDGNYRQYVGHLIRARADLLIALDLPRRTVFPRLVRRTLTRMLTGAELWNGNRESWRNVLSTDPDRNLLLFAYRRFPVYGERAVADERAGRAGGLPVVRLTSRGQVARFTRYFTAAGGRSQD